MDEKNVRVLASYGRGDKNVGLWKDNPKMLLFVLQCFQWRFFVQRMFLKFCCFENFKYFEKFNGFSNAHFANLAMFVKVNKCLQMWHQLAAIVQDTVTARKMSQNALAKFDKS